MLSSSDLPGLFDEPVHWRESSVRPVVAATGSSPRPARVGGTKHSPALPRLAPTVKNTAAAASGVTSAANVAAAAVSSAANTASTIATHDYFALTGNEAHLQQKLRQQGIPWKMGTGGCPSQIPRIAPNSARPSAYLRN